MEEIMEEEQGSSLRSWYLVQVVFRRSEPVVTSVPFLRATFRRNEQKNHNKTRK